MVYRKAVGMANVELGVPLQPDMVFRLASITKQFTATAIMLLVEQGKLALSDPIEKFLPDYPTQGHVITVEHLLTHTSGIQSYTDIPGWMTGRIKTDMKVAELVDAFKNEPMQFAPGTRYSYNNSAYVLLGAIVEKVSGQSYGAFVTEHIFKPLGMTSSFYGSNEPVIPKRVQGYTRDGDAVRNAQYLSMTQPYSAGLAAVVRRRPGAVGRGALHGEAAEARVPRPHVDVVHARRRQAHELRLRLVDRKVEGTSGRAPQRRDSRVLDLRPAPPRRPRVRGRALQQRQPEVEPELRGAPTRRRRRRQALPRAAWRRPSTRRCSPGTPASTGSTRTSSRTVTVENGKLYTQRSGGRRLEAKASSETEFFYDDSLTYFTFERDASGRAVAMLMYPDGADEPERAVRTADAAVRSRRRERRSVHLRRLRRAVRVASPASC